RRTERAAYRTKFYSNLSSPTRFDEEPKKEKVAIVACMNKLLKCLHAMIRNGTKYDYSYTVSTDH
ncbi:hypothetical protein PMU87_03140, partial [Enterococcus avium]|nr:hypothetical protein [Enterococcus avium]